MTTLTITEDVLSALRRRRSAGESVKALADGLGVTWQKLDKALRHGRRRETTRKTRAKGQGAPGCSRVAPRPAPGVGPLTERYRPRTLAEIVGQDAVVGGLREFAREPYKVAFLFEGETGTGKTSTAWALAAELGCDVKQKPPELGGLNVIASGEQTLETVRKICDTLRLRPLSGSGWKVLVVNEADRMSAPAETIWLDRLEDLPAKTVVVFTTNFAGKLSQRFKDRCIRMPFESDGKRQVKAAQRLLAGIWTRETGEVKPLEDFCYPAQQSVDEDGQLSFRRAVQLLAPALMARKGGAR